MNAATAAPVAEKSQQDVTDAHTPGPWSYDDSIRDSILIHSDAKNIAIVFETIDGTTLADARLLAAAPDLLAALRECLSEGVCADSGYWKTADRYARAVAAIAKAEGRAS